MTSKEKREFNRLLGEIRAADPYVSLQKSQELLKLVRNIHRRSRNDTDGRLVKIEQRIKQLGDELDHVYGFLVLDKPR